MDSPKTWEELEASEVGTIFYDKMEDGLRFIIMRGPAALCAYVGIPINHPLAGYDYNLLPVQAHGGLTFSKQAEDPWPLGYWWYGWDYAHSEDESFYDRLVQFTSDEREWSVEDIVKNSWSALYDFKQLTELAEAIFNKVMGWRQKLEEK